jgi:hypothetical protein
MKNFLFLNEMIFLLIRFRLLAKFLVTTFIILITPSSLVGNNEVMASTGVKR